MSWLCWQHLEPSLSVDNEQLKKLSTCLEQLSALLSPEESFVLGQRLQLLQQELLEIGRQVNARLQRVKTQLGRWSDFDESYRQLLDKFKDADEKMFECEKTSIEDVVFSLQNVWLLFFVMFFVFTVYLCFSLLL